MTVQAKDRFWPKADVPLPFVAAQWLSLILAGRPLGPRRAKLAFSCDWSFSAPPNLHQYFPVCRQKIVEKMEFAPALLRDGRRLPLTLLSLRAVSAASRC